MSDQEVEAAINRVVAETHPSYFIVGKGRTIRLARKLNRALAEAEGELQVVTGETLEHFPSCHDCGRAYGHEHGFPDLVLPNETWDKISPSGDSNGMLCPSCICRRLHRLGITSSAVWASGPLCELEAVKVAVEKAVAEEREKCIRTAKNLGHDLHRTRLTNQASYVFDVADEISKGPKSKHWPKETS